jgi:hypothetical protein
MSPGAADGMEHRRLLSNLGFRCLDHLVVVLPRRSAGLSGVSKADLSELRDPWTRFLVYLG